jgi:hypothetical protein
MKHFKCRYCGLASRVLPPLELEFAVGWVSLT